MDTDKQTKILQKTRRQSRQALPGGLAVFILGLAVVFLVPIKSAAINAAIVILCSFTLVGDLINIVYTKRRLRKQEHQTR